VDSREKTDLALVGRLCSIDGRFVLWPGGLVLAGMLGMLQGGGSMSIGQSLPYRSPISKLLRFFCGSRDKWKAKCKEAKRENKSLKYRLAKMKKSRDRWKAQARSLGNRPEMTGAPLEEETTKNRTRRRSRGSRRRHARLGVGANG
jgi:hypothetical protein